MRKRSCSRASCLPALLRITCWTILIGTATVTFAHGGMADAKSDISDDIARQPLASGSQCVPYARQISGIAIYGDAFTWWDQAVGRYARGTRPQPGAVMVFKPFGQMRLGHVAAVSRILDLRTVLLRHANWSTVNGSRGRIEDGVPAVDVSTANDWSQVRVWFDPLRDLGATHWPVRGFIYRSQPSGQPPPPASEQAPGTDPIGAIITKALRAETRRTSGLPGYRKKQSPQGIIWRDVPSKRRPK